MTTQSPDTTPAECSDPNTIQMWESVVFDILDDATGKSERELPNEIFPRTITESPSVCAAYCYNTDRCLAFSFRRIDTLISRDLGQRRSS